MLSGAEAPRATTAETVVGIIGASLYFATGVLYLGSGLVVPAPWYILLWAIWLVGLYPAYRVLRSRHRVWTFLVALAAAGVWYGIVSAGEYFLDWTA